MVQSAALTVTFAVSGGATFSSDYTQTGAATFAATAGTVTFGAGSSTVVVTIDPIADTSAEPDETVVLTVTSGTGYTVGNPSSATATIANDDPPPVPTGLTASDGTYTNKVSLSWNDVTGEGGYQVYRSTVNNSATALWLGLVGANVTSFDDTTATPGTNYYYWVRSLVLISGTYYYSNFSTPDTGYALALPPPVPTGLTASDGTYTNKVSLSWNDVTGEGGYQVYRSTVNNSATAAWLGLLGANADEFRRHQRDSGDHLLLLGAVLGTGIPGLTTTATSARPTRATPWRSRRRSPRA